MNPTLFFENFALLADSPNGIQKLRELVLQLAVMGKLVPQDPNDEPASVLLEKIKSEKEKSNKEGKLNSTKMLTPVKKEEQPFDTPIYWKWCKLGDIFNIVSGNAFKSGDFNEEDGIKTIKITNVGVGSFIETNDYLPLNYDKLYPQFLVNSGDILIALTRPYISDGLKVCYCPVNYEKSLLNQRVAAIKEIIKELSIDFVYYYFKSLYVLDYVKEKSKTMNQPNLSIKDLNNLSLPIPPLAEQKRIVSKVDELMALCDKLEARRQKKQEIQSKLNSAALDKMLSAENQEEFEQNWQRICENFDLLYDNPENVEKLKQGILQLAVQGKLVPQNPDDEPTSFLIEKIEAERGTLAKKGDIKKNKTAAAIELSEMPYDLPDNWEWVKVEQIAKNVEYGTSEKASEYQDGIPVLRMNNVQNGKIVYNDLKYMSESIKDLPRLFLKHNDLLFNRTNSYELVGKTGIFKGEDDTFTLASYLIRVSLFNEYIIPDFINISLNSDYFRKTQIEPEITQQCGQANFNGTKLKNSLVPLPPLKEQKRIVEKVEQFMGLCDELEAKLRKEREDSEKLMEAVIKDFLEGAATEKTELERLVPLQAVVN